MKESSKKYLRNCKYCHVECFGKICRECYTNGKNRVVSRWKSNSISNIKSLNTSY